MERIVLITNLSGVNVRDIRLHARAVILQDKPGTSPRFRARGFGCESTMPVFDMEVPSLEYDFKPDDPPPWMTELGGEMLTTHGMLRIRREDRDFSHDATIEMLLDCSSADRRPIDFEHIMGDPAKDRDFYSRLWARLQAKVASYWNNPQIPTVQLVRTELVQRACPVLELR